MDLQKIIQKKVNFLAFSDINIWVRRLQLFSVLLFEDEIMKDV